MDISSLWLWSVYKPVSRRGVVAGGAIAETARMTLQRHELDVVVGFTAGRDGMRAVVTGLAV